MPAATRPTSPLSAAALLLLSTLSVGAAELPDHATLRQWVEEMKTSERGPFARIRWFCNDGTVLPPKAYACRPHGGGRQHGEWTQRVQQLRAGGYQIANVYAALDVEAFLARDDQRELFAQMLVEHYLYRVDDGWIFRKARFYRGALQEEDERAAKRALLLAMAGDERWIGHGYFLLRSGVGELDYGEETPSVVEVRQLAVSLAGRDPAFGPLRVKIHGRPEASDAALVREHAAGVADEALRAEFERLAGLIDEVYTPGALGEALEALAGEAGASSAIGEIATRAAGDLAAADARERFLLTAALMADLRDALGAVEQPSLRLEVLETSLRAEDEHFTAATELREALESEPPSRREQVSWLRAGVLANYGVGLLTPRQREALVADVAALDAGQLDLAAYKASLEHLALATAWADRRVQFLAGEAVVKLAMLEPLAAIYVQDALRATPLFFYAAVVDGLLRDANRLAGVRSELFGKEVGGGLRALNPGIARGTLHAALGGEEEQAYDESGIYLLPETIAELPPVAGILTAGEGNPVSHVQLLARNLGIPNVAVGPQLVEEVAALDGRPALLAVSASGSVRLAEYSPKLDALFDKTGEPTSLIVPDMEKLDLEFDELVTLGELRAADSGRIVGPKAAKLGELAHHYPDAVSRGVAIPFGVFRDLLDRPHEASGQTMFEWMVASYDELEKLPEGSPERRERTARFRESLEDWIENVELDEDLKTRITEAMASEFGADGSYGVFVRSDTNVEDLPGFTGAGLNLTVVNVVGVDEVLAAIPRVWASPFSERAFAWRQGHMDTPEHVYPAVLLMESVDVDKSGVLVTQDLDSGSRRWYSVAVNEGVGGAVDGQAAESLRVSLDSGEIRLMAEATATVRRSAGPDGGVTKLPVSDADRVLQPAEIEALSRLVVELPERFPPIVDDAGNPAPADIEFGFLDGELKLFQIRPFLESRAARGNEYLRELDAGMKDLPTITVDMGSPPGM